jgi:succinyl-CoA synthetase beta subunit
LTLFIHSGTVCADVAATFKGIIQAITEQAAAIKAANVRLFIRRGGPNYQQVRVTGV